MRVLYSLLAVLAVLAIVFCTGALFVWAFPAGIAVLCNTVFGFTLGFFVLAPILWEIWDI